MAKIIKMTPNDEHNRQILTLLKENDSYCPCSIVKNESTKCMCADFRSMDEGTCRCGLYEKKIIDINE